MNNPSNPCGSVFPKEHLLGFIDIAARHKLPIIADEIYGELVYGDFEQKSILEVAPELKERTILVDGVSKTYAMTGWRIGWMLAPKQVATKVNTIQGQSTSHTCSIAQYAAIAALNGDPAVVEGFRSAFRRRRDLLCREIAAIPGLSFHLPQGAFYLFVDCTALIGRTTPVGQVIATDGDLALYLLDEAGVALVPGSGFLAPGHLRISYAAADETLLRAARAMAATIARLS